MQIVSSRSTDVPTGPAGIPLRPSDPAPRPRHPATAPRRRAIGAVLTLCGLGLVAAACGGGHPAQSRAGRSAAPQATAPSNPGAPPATTSSAPAAADGQPCTAGQLALSVQGPTGAAGEILYTLVFRNTATTTCTLQGYPQVTMTGSGGSTVGQPLGSQPGTTPTALTLGGGGQATAAVALHDPSVFGCPTGTATGVDVVPPGGSGPASAASLPRSTAVCTGVATGAVGSNATVTPGTVGPVQAGG